MKYQHVYNEYEIIISSKRFISKPFYADNLVWNIFCKDFLMILKPEAENSTNTKLCNFLDKVQSPVLQKFVKILL